jgi:putative ABC transport system permease protein
LSFLIRMAWRDSRGQRGRLFLFLSCITIGVAAVVALRAFWVDVTRAINEQSLTLVGADLVVRSRTPFTDELTKELDALPGEHSREMRFATMAWFPQQEQTRLVQVRAIEGNFPFYGKLKVAPESSIADMRAGAPVALVEESLLLQFNAKVGDAIRIGEMELAIGGSMSEIPGETVAMAQLAPRVLVHYSIVEQTKLMGFGSRKFHRRTFKLPGEFDLAAFEANLKKWRKDQAFSYDTVATRQESIGRSLENLFQFLNLVALAALILGGIGIGSSVHLYVRGKLASVAVLRCLGASGGTATRLYLLQAVMMGIVGGVLGSLLGIGVQHALPHVLAGMLPVEVSLTVSPVTLLIGVGIGIAATLLFSLEPLLSVRRISPLMTLRQDFEAAEFGRWTRWGLRLLVAVAVVIAAVLTARTPKHGLAFSGGLLAVFALLAALATALLWTVRRTAVHKLPFAIRQGILNLYRPRNQTLLLTLAIGAGTFLIMTLHLSQAQILSQFSRSNATDSPNMILFDVQTDQVPEIKKMLEDRQLPELERVPIVTMRLAGINGVGVEDLRLKRSEQPRGERRPRWALNREYRSTYRSEIGRSEKVIRGTFTPVAEDPDGIVPISIEDGIAEQLQVDLGDNLTFDVQGVPVETEVTSVRKVDWYRVEPNFFVVFPTGVLEEAPQMIVVATRVPDAAASADLQKAAVSALPNVSVVDLSLVVGTLTKIFDSMTAAIDFMAILSIVTGIIVLICSLTVTRVQRQRESVLLKTLGASRSQLLGIMTTEFLLIGLLAGGSGAALATAAAWSLGHFVFESSFIFAWPAIVIGVISVMAITLVVGTLTSLDTYRKPSLEVLRGSD